MGGAGETGAGRRREAGESGKEGRENEERRRDDGERRNGRLKGEQAQAGQAPPRASTQER